METEFLKMSCPFCSGGIEFPTHGEGSVIPCPHCGKDIVLACEAPPLPKQSQPPPPLPAQLLPSQSQCIPPEMPSVRPCKACGQIVAVFSEFCVHCGQGWPGLYVKCPQCKHSDFDICQDEGPTVLVPANPFIYMLGSLFQNAVESALPRESYMVCKICGAAFVPD